MRPLAAQTIAPAGDERAFFRQAFAWMSCGLLVTGAVAYGLGRNADALHAFLGAGGGWLFVALLFVELLLVGGLVTLVSRMDLFETAAIFLGYAALNGHGSACSRSGGTRRTRI